MEVARLRFLSPVLMLFSMFSKRGDIVSKGGHRQRLERRLPTADEQKFAVKDRDIEAIYCHERKGAHLRILQGVYASVVLLIPSLAWGQNDAVNEPLNVFLLFAALILIPLTLVMMSSFVKIVVVLFILRSAFGARQIPPGIIILGLALILSAYIMAPTGEKVYQAIQPELQTSVKGSLFSSAGGKTLYRAVQLAKEPVAEFLIRQSQERDRRTFYNLALRLRSKEQQRSIGKKDFQVLVPAFVIGQLTSAFKVGFLLFVPFLIIDLVVANILLALGMHMLSPLTISLPFKLLLFVLVDGWSLVTQGLILSSI